jgi:hypothetical protein
LKQTMRQQLLLCSDRKMDVYIKSVSGQWLGKSVSVAAVKHAAGETEFCVRGPPRGFIKKRIGAISSVDSWQIVLYWNLEGRT